MRKKRLVVPSTETLCGLLDQAALRRRERLQEGQAKGVEARRLNAKKRLLAKARNVRRRDADGNWRTYRVPYVGLSHNECEQKLALPCWQVLAARMVPGDWYGVPDLYAIAPEYARSSIRHNATLLWRRGITERARNAAFDDSRPSVCQAEPQWLHRLTEAGAEQAKLWATELIGQG